MRKKFKLDSRMYDINGNHVQDRMPATDRF